MTATSLGVSVTFPPLAVGVKNDLPGVSPPPTPSPPFGTTLPPVLGASVVLEAPSSTPFWASSVASPGKSFGLAPVWASSLASPVRAAVLTPSWASSLASPFGKSFNLAPVWASSLASPFRAASAASSIAISLLPSPSRALESAPSWDP